MDLAGSKKLLLMLMLGETQLARLGLAQVEISQA